MDTLQQIASELEERYNKALELKDNKNRAKEFLIIAATAIGLVKTLESVPSSQEKLDSYVATLNDHVYETVVIRKDKNDLCSAELYRSLDGAILSLGEYKYHGIMEFSNATGIIWGATIDDEQSNDQYVRILKRRLKL